jgi:SOS response regulatory protein OraA/RecX
MTDYTMIHVSYEDLAAKSDSDRIRDETLRTARSVAVRWIGFGLKSSGNVRDYLLRRGFAADIADSVIEELTSEGTIDDRKLSRKIAARRTDCRAESATQLRNRLKKQGVDPEAIEKAVAKRPADQELALSALTGRFRSDTCQTREQQMKMLRFLAGRGFSAEVARDALKQFMKGTFLDDID